MATGNGNACHGKEKEDPEILHVMNELPICGDLGCIGFAVFSSIS